ncbi:hypothetical protein LXL04_004237 [Taraxacum kok-saghyz]
MLQIGKTKHDEASIKSRSEKRNTMRHRSREKEDGVDCGSGETLLKERLPVHFLCSSKRNSLTRKLPRFTFVEIDFGDGTTGETSVKNFPEKVTGDEFLIQADELEALPAETYCMWRPKADCGSSPSMTKIKKSSSTGSGSKRCEGTKQTKAKPRDTWAATKSISAAVRGSEATTNQEQQKPSVEEQVRLQNQGMCQWQTNKLPVNQIESKPQQPPGGTNKANKLQIHVRQGGSRAAKVSEQLARSKAKNEH